VKGPPPPRPGRGGAAPGSLGEHSVTGGVEKEHERALNLSYSRLPAQAALPLSLDFNERVGRPGGTSWFGKFMASLSSPEKQEASSAKAPTDSRRLFDPAPRQQRQFDELVDHTQKLLPVAVQKRHDFFWSKLDP